MKHRVNKQYDEYEMFNELLERVAFKRTELNRKRANHKMEMSIRLLSAIVQIAFWVLLFQYCDFSQGTAFFFGVFACMLDNFFTKIIDTCKERRLWDRGQ